MNESKFPRMDKDALLHEFSGSFLKLMETAYECTKYGYTGLNISTMTLICQTNSTCTDIDAVVSKFDEHIDFPAELKKKKRTDVPVVTKRGKIINSFFNQATMTFKDITTKSIKIFTNGNLQMTGITSLLEGIRVAHRVCALLTKCTEVDIYPVALRIAMINSDFHVRKRVNLPGLKEVIRHKTGVDVGYDPDTYPGLKVYYDVGCQCTKGATDGDCKCKKVSIFVFSTGAVVITGSKSIPALHKAFAYVTDVIAHSGCIWGETIEKKRKMVKEHGYAKNIVDCCTSTFTE